MHSSFVIKETEAYNFDADWTAINLIMRPPYNVGEEQFNYSLAASLWLLDEIRANHKMRIFDKSNLSFGIRVVNTKLIVELFFCAALRKDHLLIVVGRGKVRLEHDIVEQLLAGCEQNIDLRTPGIMLGL